MARKGLQGNWEGSAPWGWSAIRAAEATSRLVRRLCPSWAEPKWAVAQVWASLNCAVIIPVRTVVRRKRRIAKVFLLKDYTPSFGQKTGRQPLATSLRPHSGARIGLEEQ